VKEPTPIVFLERETYRKRRTMDAARALPVLGVVLVLIPLFASGSGAGTDGTATALVYYFGVWLFLIGLAAVLSRRLGDVDTETGD
jgi:hypothetical protein